MTKGNLILLVAINKLLEIDTGKMLDNDDYENMPKFKISYNGINIDIPLDYAGTNNEVSYFLESLIDEFKDYLDI